MNFLSRFIRQSRLSSIHLFVIFYMAAIFVSTLILGLPFFHNPGIELRFIDILFTAVSAVSVTGLTVVSTQDVFNVAGKIALTFFFQVGGIGIMALGTFIWILLGKKIGFSGRKLLQVDHNRNSLSGVVRIILQVSRIIILIELVGTIILSSYFLTYFDSWKAALLQGYFAAVSATTNAGFDITGASLVPFADDYFVQTVTMILVIAGAIGFPVLIEIQDFFRRKQVGVLNKQGGFSLFTKLTVITFFSLLLAGTLLILFFERDGFLAGQPWHQDLFYSLFQSVTARSGGLSTMDVNEFSVPTLSLISVLMFIGASPSSVGGGIRTTTFAIMLLAIWNYAKGNTSIKIFKREIEYEDVIRSFIVITTASLLCITAIILLCYLETLPLLAIVFEVCSAFGTTGLSMGITPELSNFGKVVIMCLMFIGRIGIFSLLFLLQDTITKDIYHHPAERVIIG